MARTSTRGRRERGKARASTQRKSQPSGSLKKAPLRNGQRPQASTDVLEPISVRVRVGDWVIGYLNSKRADVVETDTLKSLKFDDVDREAMRAKFNGDFGTHVAPVEMRSEFDKPNETVGGLVLFLSEFV